MDIKAINKIVLILGLFLIIIGTGILLNNSDVGRDYISWVRSVFSKINPLKAGISLDSLSPEELGIDYSDIDFEELMSEEKEERDEVEDQEEEEELPEELLVEENQEKEIVLEPEKMTLPRIEEKVNEIEKQTKQVNQEVESLLAINEIRKEVDIIAERVKKVGQEVNNLRVLGNLQEKVDKITKKTDVLTENIVELV